jgi:hypothetical protein
MYPHERSLVERLQDKPFALLGVNSDTDREELKQAIKTERINWRSWWDGDTKGPIHKRWQVRGWPTLFLIDHNGVIRQKFEGAPPVETLDRAIKQLLPEI